MTTLLLHLCRDNMRDCECRLERDDFILTLRACLIGDSVDAEGNRFATRNQSSIVGFAHKVFALERNNRLALTIRYACR